MDMIEIKRERESEKCVGVLTRSSD